MDKRSVPASARFVSRRTRERSRALVIGAVSFGIVALGAALAAKLGVPLLDGRGSSSSLTWESELRTAKIISKTLDQPACRQQDYDNLTGLMAGAPRPCDGSAENASAPPAAPSGTSRRLDDISRSFNNR